MPVQQKVSALVLNWRDTDRTLRCVKSLLESELIERVLIVDNEAMSGSTLGRDLKHMDSKRIQLLSFSENRGFAGGINPGLQRLIADGIENIIVINNDATISPESVETLLNAQRGASPLTLVGPRICYPDGSVQAAGSRIHWATAKVDHASWPNRTDYLTWACVLITKEIIETVGYLDERFFMYWEDADFSLRLSRLGGSTRVIVDAHATHEESATKEVIGNLTIRYATASLATFTRKDPRLWLGAHYRLIMRILRQSFRHGPREGLRTIQAWGWGWKTTSPAWKNISTARWTR